jgi:hypothetical protein
VLPLAACRGPGDEERFLESGALPPLNLLCGPGEGAGQLGARAEAALAEHAGPVVLDRLGAEEQAVATSRLDSPPATSRATGVSWEVNGSETSGRRDRAVAPMAPSSSARRAQAVRVHGREGVLGGPKLLASGDPSPGAPQPGAVQASWGRGRR